MNNAEQQFLNELDNKFWKAADKLRANMDAANYKHVVLGLIFLKYVSDAFEARQQELITLFRDVGNRTTSTPYRAMITTPTKITHRRLLMNWKSKITTPKEHLLGAESRTLGYAENESDSADRYGAVGG